MKLEDKLILIEDGLEGNTGTRPYDDIKMRTRKHCAQRTECPSTYRYFLVSYVPSSAFDYHSMTAWIQKVAPKCQTSTSQKMIDIIGKVLWLSRIIIGAQLTQTREMADYF